CRETEIGYGLQAVRGRPGQAKAAAGRSEAEAARRRGHPEPDRLALQRAVRAAATQATSEADFVRNLRAAKLVVRPRYAEGGRSSVVGYSVAIRADRPIWYGGGKLARDLTLPALRLTWATDAADRQAALTEWRGPASAAVPGITYGV